MKEKDGQVGLTKESAATTTRSKWPEVKRDKRYSRSAEAGKRGSAL